MITKADVVSRKHDGRSLGCVWTRLGPVHTARIASVAVRVGTFRHAAYQEVHLDVYEHDWDPFILHVLLPSRSAPAHSDTWRILSENPSRRRTVPHRAGNATCLKRLVQDDMNGPLRSTPHTRSVWSQCELRIVHIKLEVHRVLCWRLMYRRRAVAYFTHRYAAVQRF
jgi:hypothetical protein